jgi:hypothetical protein
MPLEKRHSFNGVKSGILRSGSLLRKGNRTSAASVPEVDEELVAQFDGIKRTGRVRADSASTVLVHRAASNRAKHHQATWRPDLLDAQREMSESPNEPIPTNSPTPQRRRSVARPILPATDSATGPEAEGQSSGVAMPRSIGVPPLASPDKRESSATTATTSTSNDTPRKPLQSGGSMRKKKGGWRRLLCGGQHDI